MDSVQKKILDLSTENQIHKFSQFSTNYSTFLRSLSTSFAASEDNSAYLKTESCAYGEVSEFDLLSGSEGSKTILVFYHLLDEAERLLSDLKHTQETFIGIDNEANDLDDRSTSLDVQISRLSAHFIFLCETARLIVRLIECSRLIAEQCIGGVLVAYPKGDGPVALHVAIEAICRIMRQVETCDELINSSRLKFLWLIYKDKVFSHYQMIESQVAESAKGVSTFIEELDGFFMGNYFDIFLTEISSTQGVAQNDSLLQFANTVLQVIKGRIKETQRYKSDLSDYQETDNLIAITLLVVLSFRVFGNINSSSSVFKQLLTLHGKHCALSILPNALWRPEIFLSRHADELIGKQWTSYAKNLQNQRKVYLHAKLATLQKSVNLLAFQVITVTFEVQTTFGGQEKRLNTPDHLHSAIDLLKRHLLLSGQLRCTITNLINLHVAFELDLPRTVLISVGKLVELLVSMRRVIEGHRRGIQGRMQTALELFQFKLLSALDAYRKRVTKAKKWDQKTVELVQIVEKCVNGAMTRKRLLVLRLISSTSDGMQSILSTDGDAVGVAQLMDHLQFAFNPMAEADFERLMDTLFLFYNPSILKVYLKNFLLQYEDPRRLQNFVAALASSSSSSSSSSKATLLLPVFQDTLRTELVQKLSREIENHLRLDFHKQLHKQTAPPLNTTMQVRDLRGILHLNPLHAFDRFFAIKGHVEQQLSHTFYSLITVSPHDCRTYGDMRQMAGCCYELETVPDGLPVRTVDQACDIMEILRDLSVFVRRFCYDMNGQVFVEKESENKHLNAILVAHVSQSIQTHGIGIINTTVNVTYQFLKKKFHVFSQLLFDEHVKSRLIRDHRIVAERIGTKTVPVYPMEAGANLIKHLRTVLVMTSQQQTGVGHLDRLRELLIEIGNALGFVRSMRSGRLDMGANAVEHFNWTAAAAAGKEEGEEEEEGSYLHQRSLIDGDDGDQTIGETLEHLRSAIQSQEDNFSESADYLTMLVNAFQRHVQSDKFAHLRKFFLIVPALTMNYVEHMIILKEDLAGLPRSRCHQYTEDGFNVGLVYLLTVLEQMSGFNSLHWFASVDQYYGAQVEKLAAENGSTGIDQEKLQQTKTLSAKRLRLLQREFNLLYYNVSSSKIFFQ